MKKIQITCLFIFGFFICGFAQNVQLNLLPFNSKANDPSLIQLIQFQLNNSSSASNVYIQVSISSNIGSVILRTPIINIEEGLNNSYALVGVNGSKLNIVQASPEFNNVLNPSYTFPSGNYNYCVEVLDMERVPIAKACNSFQHENRQSLLLVYPFHKQQLEEQFPVFSWTSVFSNMNSDVRFKIKWVERSKPFERNVTNLNAEKEFHKIHEVKENFLSYNTQHPSFDKSKYYYWQVEAYSGLSLIASSQVWEFSFKNERSVGTGDFHFVKVDSESKKDLHVFSGDSVNFEWVNKYNDYHPYVKIFSEDGLLVHSQVQIPFESLASGVLYFKIATANANIQDNKVYTLHLEGPRKDYKIKFKRVP